ncbi:MAG: ChaN family lipoprotein, partial [Gammaproteobacteria bacterium]
MNILLTVKNLKHFLNALFILFVTLGSVTAAEQWQAPFFQDHKLVGKVWDTHKNAWLSTNKFKFELAQYDYILLGETHNNPDHHRLQAEAINSLVDLGLKPVVVMEMLSQHAWQDQPKIWEKASELQELAGMLNDGWPWELYAPILQSISQHQLKLFAG